MFPNEKITFRCFSSLKKVLDMSKITITVNLDVFSVFEYC